MDHVTTAYDVLIGYSLMVETGKTGKDFVTAVSAVERGKRT